MGDGSSGVVAVVLAAGSSTRWGALAPKSLAPVNGVPAISHIAGAARAAGCGPVLAVVADPAISGRLNGGAAPDRWLINPDPDEGRGSSLRIGLAAVPAASGALIWPVDVPFVRTETVRRLLDTVRRESLAVWLTPTFEGRGGHPIALTRSGVDLARRLPTSVPLRDAPFRRGLGERRIPVDDPGVIDNTNYYHEFAAAERAWRAREGTS